ncbi:MAG: hypothetical protein ACP5MI_09810 [Candidatus Kryptoniota bacterium]
MVAIVLISMMLSNASYGDTLTTRKMVNNYYIFYNPPAVIIPPPVYPVPYVVPVPLVIYRYPVPPLVYPFQKGIRQRAAVIMTYPRAGIKPKEYNARQIRAR